VTDNIYESFFNLSVDMLCLAGFDGYFKRINTAWTRTLGFTQAELMARPYMDFVHPDDRAATVAEAGQLAHGATSVHFRNRYESRDGSYRWLAWAAMPATASQTIFAVARDITQEVEAESELKRANLAADTRLALLTALVDAINVGVILVDRDLVVKHWNKEASRVTGVPAEKILDQPARLLGDALSSRVEDYSTVRSRLQHAFGPVDTTHLPMVILEPRREIDVTVSPALLPSDGRQVGSVIVLHDVTAAMELDRAKDELIGMVSHELRTPLASLVGFTELLLDREFTDAQRKQYLETMLKEGRRLTDLINDFLDLQGLEGGYKKLDLGPADLRAVIMRAIVAEGDDPGRQIEVDLPSDLPLVIADTNAILQVLINMLSNARKYSPGGGSIRVRATVIGEVVEVSIQDQGLGFPPDALPMLFNKFYRVANPDRRQIAGTGLGLAISRRIIEVHGGRVGAESAGLGLGSRFYFTLRIVTAEAKSGDVLLVEDDVGFARLLEAELAVRELTSVWAPDSETAGRLIGQMTPRAVVLDLMLPGASGEEFLARLRAAQGIELPVVVVTIKELEATETLALRTSGVLAVIKKHSGAAKEAALFVAEALAKRGLQSG
jgi:PAS domain S-box-containing protein